VAARLLEHAGEGLVGEIGAEDVEGGQDLGHQRPFQGRPQSPGLFRLVTQRLRQRPDEIRATAEDRQSGDREDRASR
jgi:hypothetical protein